MSVTWVSSWQRPVWLPLLIAVSVAVGCARRARDTSQPAPILVPHEAVRFWIARTTDSTVSFRTSNRRWLRSGMVGYAVDPSLHDSLVARIQLTHVHADSAIALITGQLRPVDSTHVVLVEQPRSRWWRTAVFWGGTLAGATAATSIALITRQ